MLLITGGAGFIGSHLAEVLLRQGKRIRILDNLSTGKKENLDEISGKNLNLRSGTETLQIIQLTKNLEFYYGDITDFETCHQACKGITGVFHEAALGSVQRSVEDPIASHHANATGTLHILTAAQEAKVKRVVYASSSSVYGNISSNIEEVAPKTENLPTVPQSPYAATKLLGEIYCRLFFDLYGLETVSLRYFNVFGPRQNPDSMYAAVIPKFISALQKKESPLIYGDGNQSRDFTFVENVVQANILALETPGISGEVFNIACGQRTSVNELFVRLQKISGSTISPCYEKVRKGEVRHSLAGIEQAQIRLGYEPQVEIDKGLEITWNWIRGRIEK